jgi:hypothetical protein
MSQSDMAAAVLFSNPKIPNDDDASGGFQNVKISLRPPSCEYSAWFRASGS